MTRVVGDKLSVVLDTSTILYYSNTETFTGSFTSRPDDVSEK